MFDNDTPEPDVELIFHQALTRSTRDHVEARLLAPEAADLVVRGRITYYGRRAGLRSTENTWVESGVIIDAEAQLFDRRQGTELGPSIHAGTTIGYTLAAAENETAARDRALRHLADRMILELLLSYEIQEAVER